MKVNFKQFLFLILFLLLLSKSESQISKFLIDSTSQNPWVYYAEKMCFTPDGGLLIFRKIPNQTPINTSVLIKTDANLQFVWSKELNNLPPTVEINDIGILPGNNGYYLQGDYLNGTQNDFVIKTDLSGNITFAKSFNFGITSMPYLSSSVKFFTTGEMLLFFSDFSNMRCAIIDTTGNLINSFSFSGDSSSLKSPGMNSRVLGDSLFLFTAKNDSSPALGVLSKTGNVKWVKRYYYPGLYEQPRALELLQDSCIMIGGSYVDYNTNSNGSFLMKVDKNGNFLWKKIYASAFFTGFTIAEIIEKPNGNIIAKDLFDGMFMETDANGLFLSAKIVDGNNVKSVLSKQGVAVVCNKFNTAISTYNPSIHKSDLNLINSCLFVDYNGMSTVNINNSPNIQSGFYQAQVAGTSTNENYTSSNSTENFTLQDVCSAVGTNEIYNQNNFRFYPIPTSNNLNLQINNKTYEDLNYSIFDLQGKKVKSGKLSSENSDHKISVEELEYGTYILYLTEKNSFINQCKIVVFHQ
ncbi:MAG: T9SS type A sorting domain-containing protein [Bacteroidota bacterium]|jgi:hypothetical protein